MEMLLVVLAAVAVLQIIILVLLFKVLKSRGKSEEILGEHSLKLDFFSQEMEKQSRSLQDFDNGLKIFAERQQIFGEQFREFSRESRELAKDGRESDALARKELREVLQKQLGENREAQTQVFSIMVQSQKEAFAQIDKTQKEAFAQMDKTQKDAFAQMDKTNKESYIQLEKSQRESLERLDKSQNQLIKNTDERLENIRVTVAEKLDKTLTERLGKSFETVGKQLNEVQQGLGEMKNLAQDVGGLKKVLSNVKMRGGLGEIQLQMLLENILAPDQYCANVITKKASREVVEFAVKLPGNSDDIPNIWLPIDAKFPKDVYEKLQNAYDLADPAGVEAAQKELDAAIKLNAKDISGKYVDPPYTTNFAIMFLPFEGIYAEVVRKAELLEYIQRQYNVIITGPTTLAAILNSLQIGFKTLAIQKRSSEVWETLGAVKTEFDNFGGLLDKAKNKIQGGLNDMDTLIGTRTRAIQRKLRSVESLDQEQSQKLLEMD